MRSIEPDLLWLDQRQATLAPHVLAHLRVNAITPARYFELMMEDLASGQTLLEWGDKLAQEGILTVAKRCWEAADLPEETITKNYLVAKEAWIKRIAQATEETRELFQEYKSIFSLEQRKEYEVLLFEIEEKSKQDWYDLAEQLLVQFHKTLQTSIGEFQEEQRLKRSRFFADQQAFSQGIARLDPFPFGEKGRTAAQGLLLNIENRLKRAQVDEKEIQHLFNLLSALCDGKENALQDAIQAIGERAFMQETNTAAAPQPMTPSTRESLATPQDEQRIERSEQLAKKAQELRLKKRYDLAKQDFREALKIWPSNGAAAKNYATMLKEQGDTRGAITVLLEGLKHVQERLTFYNLLTGYSIDINDFGQAREYAQQALRLTGDIRAEIGVLDSLITLEQRAGNLQQAIDYCDTILRLNPSHEHYRKKRAQLISRFTDTYPPATLSHVEQPAQEVAPGVTEEISGARNELEITELSLEISPLLIEDLERCELTKVSPLILRHSVDLTKIIQEADRLWQLGMNLNVRQPKEGADHFLQAAKIVVQTKAGASTNQSTQRSLNYYTGTIGDYFLSINKRNAAQAYFLEHMRLFNKQWLEFSLHRIVNYFKIFSSIGKIIGSGNIESDKPEKSIQAILAQALDITAPEDQSELLNGIVDMACANRTLHSILNGIMTAESPLAPQLLPLLQKEAQDADLKGNISKLFNQRVARKKLFLEQQGNYLHDILTMLADKRGVREADHKLQVFTEFLLLQWNDTDLKLFGQVQNICRDTLRYFEENRTETTESKDYLERSIVIAVDKFHKQLDDEPTYLGRAFFSRIVYRFRRLVEEEHRRLRQASQAELEPTIVKTAWIIPQQKRRCHLEITNKGTSTAQDVVLFIHVSEDGDYTNVNERISIGSIPARYPKTIEITIELQSPQIAEKEAIDLHLSFEYLDLEDRKRETKILRLRLQLLDEITFEEIVNPYRPSGAVESKMFYGRDTFIDELISIVSYPERTSSVVIYGQKRSGKSSILNNVHTRTLAWLVPVYISMHNTLPVESSTEEASPILPIILFSIADEIRQALNKHLDVDSVEQLTWDLLVASPGPSHQFRMYLQRTLRSRGLRLVLMIDEFTELADKIEDGKVDAHIMKYLKSLIEQGFFSCIIAGVDSMPQVLKEYSNELAISDLRSVDYLDSKAASALIEQPIFFPDGKTRFTSSQAVTNIINLTAGSPYYIQYVCQRLVEWLNQSKSPTVTSSDVDRVVEDLISGTLNAFVVFDNLFRYKEKEDKDTYETILEGLFLYLLADETRTRKFALMSDMLQRAPFVKKDEFIHIADLLRDRQVIEVVPGSPRQYRIIVDLFRRWINAKRPIDEDELYNFQRKLERKRK